jgi:hypothetical protein
LDQVHSHRGTPTGPWHPSVGGWGSWTPRFEIPPGFYDGLVCYVLCSSGFPPFDGSCSGDRGRPNFVGGVIAHPPAKNSNRQRSTRNEREQRHNKQRASVALLYQAPTRAAVGASKSYPSPCRATRPEIRIIAPSRLRPLPKPRAPRSVGRWCAASLAASTDGANTDNRSR